MEAHELQSFQRKPVARAQEANSLLSSSDNSPNSESLPPGNNNGFVSRLGKYQLTMLTASFIVCFGCLAFLTFLWAADTNNAVWRRIILGDWATRSVTIASLVLRWATGMQAIICTCMLAATHLKVGTVPLAQAAAMSITRFDNTGPWSLLKLMGVKWCSGSILINLLTLLLSLTTLLLQFSSTILLSRIGLGYLPVERALEQTYYGFDNAGASIYQDSANISFLHSTPVGYPAFAEYTFNDSRTYLGGQFSRGYEPLSGPNIRDTGTVLRAFLPIRDANERNLTIKYEGNATVLDTRVVCMKPNLTNIGWFHDDISPRLFGRADVDTKPRGYIRDGRSQLDNKTSLTFDCGFLASTADNYTAMNKEWPLAVCTGKYLDWAQGMLIFKTSLWVHWLVGILMAEADSPSGINSIMSDTSRTRTYLIINGTYTAKATDMEDSDVWQSLTLTNTSSKDIGYVWPTETVTVQVTLCMTAFTAREMKIPAIRQTSFPAEPTLSWDVGKGNWAADDVMRQLDTGLSVQERGLFDLELWSYDEIGDWEEPEEYSSRISGDFATVEALDQVQDYIYATQVNKAQFTVFAQMAAFTGSPALALQAFFTTLCATAYYDRIVTFDKSAPSTRVSLTQVTRPLGWASYIVVLTVLLVHLLLVTTVTFMFFRAGKLVQMGNAWAAVSHPLGPETEAWIRDVDTLDDKTVKKWLKSREKHDTLVQLAEVDSRVHIVKKDKRS
jgi:hypothetical protein